MSGLTARFGNSISVGESVTSFVIANAYGEDLAGVIAADYTNGVNVAIGNSGDPNFIPVVERLLDDASPLVRAMAVWALAQLMSQADFQQARDAHAMTEPDLAVKTEWSSA